MKHFREFPGASLDHWLTTDPNDEFLGPDPQEDDEQLREMVECDLCGKFFEFDYDNEKRGSNGVSLYYCCDGCISLGLHERAGRRGDGDV